jgi:hypothetical protein
MFSSCKKSSESPKLSVASIVFDLNGTKHTLTNNVVEHNPVIEGVPQFISNELSASSSQNKEDIALYINHLDSLKTGTNLATNSTLQGNASMLYHNEYGSAYNVQHDPNPNCTIRITEIGPGYMKGTFSAVLSNLPQVDSTAAPNITITNGEFYAKVKSAN